MAVNITVESDPVNLAADVTLSGLVAGTRYDVLRMSLRYAGDDPDTGAPFYERESPDRKAFWRTVAHRQGWQAPAATVTFRDHEAAARPFSYFVVETSKVGPFEYDWDGGDYPVSRGVLDDQVVDFLREILSMDPPEDLPVGPGDILLRSTSELAHFEAFCVVDIEDLTYTARGAELAVLGSQYPVYISDTREARRGRLILQTGRLDSTEGGARELDDLRRLVFPANGKIRPVVMSSAGPPVLLLDDCVFLPLDIEVEQATPTNADVRFVHVSFLEIDPTAAIPKRTGDNDSLTTAPRAQFTVSPANPRQGDLVTLTDTSTGTYQQREWTVHGHTNLKSGRSFGRNPLKLRWREHGTFHVKLRVFGTDGASTRRHEIKVRRP